jgi:hypothetical protein
VARRRTTGTKRASPQHYAPGDKPIELSERGRYSLDVAADLRNLVTVQAQADAA